MPDGRIKRGDAGLCFGKATPRWTTSPVMAVRRLWVQKRIRMPSKLDPHLAMIESWLATEPQINAVAIVRRLAEIDPSTFGDKQTHAPRRTVRLH